MNTCVQAHTHTCSSLLSKDRFPPPVFHSMITFIIIIIYPSTMRVVWAPQVISQPLSSIFPCSPLSSGTLRTPGLSIPWCCLPTSSLSGTFSPFHHALQDGFGQTWWTGDMTIPLQFVSLRWSGGHHFIGCKALLNFMPFCTVCRCTWKWPSHIQMHEKICKLCPLKWNTRQSHKAYHAFILFICVTSMHCLNYSSKNLKEEENDSDIPVSLK